MHLASAVLFLATFLYFLLTPSHQLLALPFAWCLHLFMSIVLASSLKRNSSLAASNQPSPLYTLDCWFNRKGKEVKGHTGWSWIHVSVLPLLLETIFQILCLWNKAFVRILNRAYFWSWFTQIPLQGGRAEVEVLKLKYCEETDLMLNPQSQVLLKSDLLFVLGSTGQSGQLQGYRLHPEPLGCFFNILVKIQSLHLWIRMVSLFEPLLWSQTRVEGPKWEELRDSLSSVEEIEVCHLGLGGMKPSVRKGGSRP